MSRRSSNRNCKATRSTSKYFSLADNEEDNPSNDNNDSDYNPSSPKVTSKSRKRKSVDASASNNKKRSKPSQNETKREYTKKKTNIETVNTDRNNNKSSCTTKSDVMEDSDDSDDADDWEEVEDAQVFDLDEYKPSLPNNLKVTLVEPKKEKTHWLEAYIRQEINRIRKKTQLDAHKSHLLLLISRLSYLNTLSNEPTCKALIMSMNCDKFKFNEKIDKLVPKIVNWLNSKFKIDLDMEQFDNDLFLSIKSSFEAQVITSPLVFVIILVATLRLLSLQTRLCYFFNPIPIKPLDLLSKRSKKPAKKDSESQSSEPSSSSKAEVDFVLDSSSYWKYNYHWIEIFDKAKKKWICFDFVNDIKNDSFSIGSHLGMDISYILAIDNDDYISEVTQRYASDWVSYAMKKRRIEDDWWQNTLTMLKRGNDSQYEEADKNEFDQLLSKVELPKRLSDFKNHPMFVLQRDILKFQAIYPPDAPTLGFFRSEPVFARDCVHTLKSRETWLRVARTVKPNETAYKVVTSKFKVDKNASVIGQKAMLEIFGEWQTVPYEPPEAKDGIVPRNAYGNVELFLDCMLPRGTVHMKLPGLARIAGKLNIDCAPAVVGFDCNKHSRGNHCTWAYPYSHFLLLH